MLRTQCFSLLALFLLPFCSFGRSTNDAIARAIAAVEAAAPRAQTDPDRPIFHITSPAQWINDPNGPIYYNGFYHLFYQLHPFSDQDGPKFWGHVRSRDLVKWERLPIALAPSSAAGEEGVWSGCCVTNGLGTPMIFYTSVATGKSALDHSEQWAAIGGGDLFDWRKATNNPVLSGALHGETKIYDWRDPFIFRDDGKTFMVLGGSLNQSSGGQAVVCIYEAENPELTKWKYRGVLFHHPDSSVRTAECPNFFKVDDHWVLLVSPYGKVQYFIGDFDATTCRFEARTRGLLDFSSDFYAPNTMQLSDGRRIVWGWVRGFPGGKGWNGCLSLPRLLSVATDGRLKQTPIPPLEQLRGDVVEWNNINLDNERRGFQLPGTNTLEVEAEIDLPAGQAIELDFQRVGGDTQPIVVNFRDSKLTVLETVVPLELERDAGRLNLRIFIDRSVLEIFANDMVAVTQVISPLGDSGTLGIRAEGGAVSVNRLAVWPVHSLW